MPEESSLPRQSDCPLLVAVVFGDIQAIHAVDVSSFVLKVSAAQISQFDPFLS